MPLNLASPGILIREVDLTQGRVDATSDKIGGIVGPFVQGPVGTVTRINTENDLVDKFGRPYSEDKHYETWMTASSYLAYGGIMNVVRADDSGLKNAHDVGAGTTIKIKSRDHYVELNYPVTPLLGATVIAKNPGSWANDIRVAIIDAQADQRLTFDQTPEGGTQVAVGMGVTQAVPEGTVVSRTGVGAGKTELLDGHFKGIITKVNSGNVDVKVVSHVSVAGTSTAVEYNNIYRFSTTSNVAIHTAGQSVSYASTTVSGAVDWFGEQTIAVSSQTVGGTETTSTVKWNTLANAPGTSAYAEARGAKNDEIHVVVIDGKGTITGNAGTILEKHLSLSKASDAEFSVGSPSYWNRYLEVNSEYIFAGSGTNQTLVKTGFDGTGFTTFTDGGWNQLAEDADGPNIFDACGPLDLTLSQGTNYGGKSTIESGALNSGLDDLISGYSLFENESEVDVDFLLMGSGKYDKPDTRALATKLIQVAEARKDAVAFISPHRGAILTDTSDDTAVTINSVEDATTNIIDFFNPITSSSYGIFDSGYKYMYDRFNDVFRYVPLNGDIAGTCARNDINNFPWFSPAGTARGTILNAVKLAYNPGKVQRDRLYSSRVNPVIFSPGSGIILFGDKTGFAKASAFDRINVRRLFIFLEDAIAAAARDQLFEFNDEITRANFVNIVEPFLRDVQAKRGIQDFIVICDETNNTAAIIDSNEFVADIYIKPARSINFIGLNFIATRTGVAFEEVIGSV
tara:strand:+ start:3069 stop:5291 length:2223 start_codon:yes stop_codon:yes gene_type:complete